MAWLLAGFGAAVGVAWAYSEATDVWDRNVSKPWNTYWNDRAIEQDIYEREAMRQSLVTEAKNRKLHNLKNLGKLELNIDTAKYQTKLTNNMEESCTLIFVNTDRSPKSAPSEAIKWAKRELEADIFNRTNTRIETIKPGEQIIFIHLEILDYTIVLNVDDMFVTLTQKDFDTKDIYTKTKFNTKDQVGVEVNCKSWF